MTWLTRPGFCIVMALTLLNLVLNSSILNKCFVTLIKHMAMFKLMFHLARAKLEEVQPALVSSSDNSLLSLEKKIEL